MRTVLFVLLRTRHLNIGPLKVAHSFVRTVLFGLVRARQLSISRLASQKSPAICVAKVHNCRKCKTRKLERLTTTFCLCSVTTVLKQKSLECSRSVTKLQWTKIKLANLSTTKRGFHRGQKLNFACLGVTSTGQKKRKMTLRTLCCHLRFVPITDCTPYQFLFSTGCKPCQFCLSAVLLSQQRVFVHTRTNSLFFNPVT